MGSTQSTPQPAPRVKEDPMEKLMQESSPHSWHVAHVEQWVEGQTTLPHAFRDRLLSAIRGGWIDGEMCCDTPFPQLRQCLALPDDKHWTTLQSLIQRQLREHPLVAPFQEGSSDKSPDEEPAATLSSRHHPRGEICANQEWVQLIADYHDYTFNTATRGAPTVKRVWVCQPKISRRYYGATPVGLSRESPEPYRSLHNLLHYSMAVSAERCSSDVFSRSLGYKRVNPSSGGLHPIETYVIYRMDEKILLSHYFPSHHILEQRYSVPICSESPLNQLGENEFLIGLSAVQWRELWKYGPRGWRYTQLDVGHALGALLLSAQLHDYHIRVFDALAVECANLVLALEECQGATDHREQEGAQVFVHCSPRSTPSSFSFSTFLQALATSRQNVAVQGQANDLFLRSDNPMQWPYIPVLDEAVKTGATDRPFLEQQNQAQPLDALGVFADKQVLAPAIRARRSATSFTQGSASMTMADLNSCLCALVTYMSVMTENTIHVGLWIQGVEGMAVGRYLLYRGGDDQVAAHVESSGAQRVSDDQLDNQLHLYRLPQEALKPEGEGTSDSTEKKVRQEASDCSCYQGIANDCGVVFSFLAPVERQVATSPNQYRSMHWQAGLLGQLLYVNAYQRKLGATGMGCFLDPESTNVFLIPGYQPLYHFAVGPTTFDGRFSPLE